MIRELQLFNELKELNNKGLEDYIYDGTSTRIQGHHSKDSTGIEEIERYISYYKQCLPKLKELYKLTDDEEIFDRYWMIKEHIKDLESIHRYKQMKDYIVNIPVI